MAIAIPIKIGMLFVAESAVGRWGGDVDRGREAGYGSGDGRGGNPPPSFGDGKTPIGRGYIS